MSDGEQTVEGEAEEMVDEMIPAPAELVIRGTPDDMQAVALAMDANDIALLNTQVQEAALEQWVYSFDNGAKLGLTVHGVYDVIRLMNATGKCRITTIPDSLKVERYVEDAEEGAPRKVYWSVTIFAVDEVTGLALPGQSMEPVKFQNKHDVFAQRKAMQKATRNALAAHIPEVVEQTVLAIYARDPRRVRPIKTEAQAKAELVMPALDTPEAKEKIDRAEALLLEIHAVAPEARLLYTPGTFFAQKNSNHHSIEGLDELLVYLEERLVSMPGEVDAMRAKAKS